MTRGISVAEFEKLAGCFSPSLEDINFHAGIGNEMWDLNYSYSLRTSIDKILNTNE